MLRRIVCILIFCIGLAHLTFADKLLRCLSREIIDANGSIVRLRGIYSRAAWLSNEWDIVSLKNWGCNFMRITMPFDENYWATVNGGIIDPVYRGILREQDLQTMDVIAQWCEANRMYWMFCLQPTYTGFNFNLLQYYPTDPDLYASQMANMGLIISERYKDYDYIVGYEPFGEPHGIYTSFERGAYKQICQAFIDAVRTYDPNRIVSISACNDYASPGAFNDQMRIDRQNIMYAFSYYPCRSFISYQPWYGDFRYPGWIPDFYRDRVIWLDHEWLWTFGLDHGVSTSIDWNAPIYCHEFGAWGFGSWDGSSPDNSSERFMRDMVQLYEDNSVNWTIWRWQQGASDVPQWWKALWAGQPNNRVTIEPHGGTFVGSQTVTMHTFVDNADIYYSTDGNEPDESSTLYSGPFSVNDNSTIKAKAFKAGILEQPTDIAVFNEGGRMSDNPSNPIQGLHYYYYEGHWNSVPDFDSITPVSTGICSNFDPALGSEIDGKALLWKGYLEVPTGNVYYFNSRVEKSGGMEMYIGDTLVILNGGNTTYSVGMLALEQGMHQIKLGYTRPDGTGGLFDIEIQRLTDTYFVDIPSSMLYYNSASPAKAYEPNPGDQDTNVPVNYTVTWKPGADTVSHDIYFGKVTPPPFVQNQYNAAFSPSILDANTVYYWRVDEKNSYGTTTGDVWSFRTGFEKAPAGWWKFDEGSGLIASDSSGNSNHGHLYGTMDDLSWVAGRNKTALRFNGQVDYILIPVDSKFNLGTNDFSFSMWLKKDNIGTRKFLYNQRVGGYTWFAMEWTAADIIQVYGKINGPECINVRSATSLSAATWYHVVIVADRDSPENTKVYINTIDDTYGLSLINNTDMSLNRDVYIGRWAGGNGNNFDGIVDDLRIYDWALSENEITDLYKYGFIISDINLDDKVDHFDFADLALNWMEDTCTEPSWCHNCDFDENGWVDLDDFIVFVDNWLEQIQ